MRQVVWIMAIIFNFILMFFPSIVSSQTGKTIVSFCAGERHTCSAFDSKKMKCWGQKYAWGLSTTLGDYLGDEQGEIGDSMPYIDVGAGVGVIEISCGVTHVCARLDTGNMKCLGSNFEGQAGVGTITNPIGEIRGYIGNSLPAVNLGTEVKVLGIALGAFHTCAKVSGNKLKCFGLNGSGQLGQGNTTTLGTSAPQMGDNLPFIDLGVNSEIDSIYSGLYVYHNCVILSAPTASYQRIKCWGYNEYYQLGYGDTKKRGDEPGEMGDNLPLVDLGAESKVKKLSIGESYTCALLVNNVLKCFGKNSFGQLGLGSNGMISSTGDSMPSVTIDSSKTIKLMSGGSMHHCIVYDDMTSMKCIGFSNYGQLGQGDTKNWGDEPTTLIPSVPLIDLGTGPIKIKSIHCGTWHTCVVFANGNVKCFGYNSSAQLAIGSTQNIGDNANEMGNNLQYAILFSPTKAPTATTVATNPPSNPSSSLVDNSSAVAIGVGITIPLITVAGIVSFVYMKFRNKSTPKESLTTSAKP